MTPTTAAQTIEAPCWATMRSHDDLTGADGKADENGAGTGEFPEAVQLFGHFAHGHFRQMC